MKQITSLPMRPDALSAVVKQIQENPWNFKREPFQILDHIYYVGNSWVGAYLIDTGKGLILLDTTFSDVVWMLFENIRKLGFDPGDIKILLLSHGHFDHISGARYIQESCNCKTWFPKDDYFMITERRELLFGKTPEFQIDEFYDYNGTISLGNTEITPIHTPGHTLGCTSVLFKSRVGGKEYTVASHGGLGNNGLTKAELAENKLPLDTQKKYLNSLHMLAKLPVDVFIPAHNSYYDIFSLALNDDGSHTVYVQPGDWSRVMEYRAEIFEQLLREEE